MSVAETIADSVAGYTHVGERAHGFGLYAYCEHQAIERGKHARALDRLIREHGWHGDAGGTLLGSAHRLFIDLKLAISHGEEAVLRELHRGEAFLLDKIEAALAGARLDRALAEALRRIAQAVREAVAELASRLRLVTGWDGARPSPG
ncbi:DUF2383 domain-containing protein [Sphingomonas sp. Root720]|uniref:DUF2383 domain-containing protein n=1 Tax=Sphingomonas sp. Root720 TaxID=1736595 RepID=UPI0006F5F788|nr:DUF2383 domain-containing protein [Sphingomonas sp. Root720]KQX19395.1 hypothetical protein ASD17_12715 [Sphingomonas sp. Root1294]KQY65597.1 hypothetical protein ASD39_15915 [Sphingomonas sp. Root50]KRB95101.1 hypothetical protein ASE22_04140 [Sphingomonas sp. Root720]